MKDNLNVEPSIDLAYWVGVAQTDGYLKKKVSKTGCEKYIVKVGVTTSLPMLRKFKAISEKELHRTNKFWTYKKTGYTEFSIGVNKLLPIFKELDIDFSDPPKPPNWCLKEHKVFGAYLAGVVDGDGDVRVKRPKYPQCAVRISSSKPQKELQRAIDTMLNCSSNIIKVERWKTFRDGKKYFLKTYVLEFNISKKNYDLIIKHLSPNLVMPHKKKKIEDFIKKKKAVVGI